MTVSLVGLRVLTSFPGGHSEQEPPDPIPNSEVKMFCADGSVAVGHVRVGRCQGLKPESPVRSRTGLLFLGVFRAKGAVFSRLT